MRFPAALLVALLAAAPQANADTAGVSPLSLEILTGKSPYAEPAPLAAYAMPYGGSQPKTSRLIRTPVSYEPPRVA